MLTEEQIQDIFKELSYKTSRSGGKGGQNVNKVESKVEISFDVLNSNVLSEELKQKILNRPNLTDNFGCIKVISEKHRSQLENKEEARRKLIQVLQLTLRPVKKRRPTKPTKASKRKKEQSKKLHSEKKQNRRKPL
ncbi:MAG TPA: alternative ribosome rescue aminoacyl-tRNA hydrolase ArfB [Bacteroidia bacterium]|jgi:ribosome-associated protein|nr:alternative ribosome rescue aminoacyl-tRNA hydrolase ArfB [Bacteroidia bacterium]